MDAAPTTAPPLALRSRRIALPEGVFDGMVIVVGGRIGAVRAADAPLPDGCTVVDLGDLALLPGAVDTHVHVNEPGNTRWEGWATATRAAALGGTTTIVDMPLNSLPVTTSVAALEEKHRAAAGQCIVDRAYWGGLVPGMDADTIEALAAAGVVGFKAFLCDSGLPEFGHVGEADLAAAMPVLARLGLPLLAHAELVGADAPAWSGDERSHAAWAATRPPSMEHDAVRVLARLAAETGCHVHVVHASSPLSVELAAAAGTDAQGAPIVTLETCPHYLNFAAEDVPDGATEFKCAPPIRDRATREALREWVRRDQPLVASDHSPAPPTLKSVDTGSFGTAWGGIASLQLLLPATWTALTETDPDVGVEVLARCCATRPAALAGLARTGSIVHGNDASLVAFDTDTRWTVRGDQLSHRWPLTPYEGVELRGRTVRTWLRGVEIATDGRVTDEASADAARALRRTVPTPAGARA